MLISHNEINQIINIYNNIPYSWLCGWRRVNLLCYESFRDDRIMNSTPIISWIHANFISPVESDGDSNGNVWVAGLNSSGTRRVRLENWREVKSHHQYAIEWARTGV